MEPSSPVSPTPKPNLFSVLKPYRGYITLLLGLALAVNALGLALPKLIAGGIDGFSHGTFILGAFAAQFIAIIAASFVLTYAQRIVQGYASERVARDLRERVAEKVSRQTFAYVQDVTSAKLLTNLTSDVDAVKMFVSQAIVSIASSIILIIGASALLLSINWKLALAVLAILPVIAFAFSYVFSKVGALFKVSQGVIDRLNTIINESILGAALIRVVNAQTREYERFVAANTEAKNVGMNILKLFVSVIPIITFMASMATLVVLVLGGHLTIQDSMTLGELAAFNGYVSMLIFPIFIIGFMSNAISRAAASYGRVVEVLDVPHREDGGTRLADVKGAIEVKDVSLAYGETSVLKNVSFTVAPGSRNAIIGPTAAGKTQLLNVLVGLTAPAAGSIAYDGVPINEYDKVSFHTQVGFVFQDSIVFNASLRENVAFSEAVKPEMFELAVKTAELGDFVGTLPDGWETRVSERGLSLSGGQKQRLMLARALALNPRTLFLDDFTARVDANTEKRILQNIRANYPHLTLISVTQKIAPVEDYDQIILLMEGEVLAKGTHSTLMETSPEYVQIAESQRSTNHYDTHAE